MITSRELNIAKAQVDSKILEDGKSAILKAEDSAPDMLEKYDVTNSVRGKYAKQFAEGTNIVVIDPDVAEYFPDHDSVNDALRALIAILKRQRGEG